MPDTLLDSLANGVYVSCRDRDPEQTEVERRLRFALHQPVGETHAYFFEDGGGDPNLPLSQIAQIASLTPNKLVVLVGYADEIPSARERLLANARRLVRMNPGLNVLVFWIDRQGQLKLNFLPIETLLADQAQSHFRLIRMILAQHGGRLERKLFWRLYHNVCDMVVPVYLALADGTIQVEGTDYYLPGTKDTVPAEESAP